MEFWVDQWWWENMPIEEWTVLLELAEGGAIFICPPGMDDPRAFLGEVYFEDQADADFDRAEEQDEQDRLMGRA